MWEQYKKTALFMQIFILAVTVTVFFVTGRQWLPAVMLFAVMQVSGLMGAAWGARLRNRIRRSDDELPLNRRR